MAQQAAGCGQSAELASECGQKTPQRSKACGQEPEPQSCGQVAEPTGCGQAAAPDTASTCGLKKSGHQPLNAQEMAAWRAFLMASTTVTAALNHELVDRAGISLLEYEILVRLSEAPEHTLRMSALAQDTAQSRSRLTHTVVRLEKTGYVERSLCSSDRRGVYCHLTEAGTRFLTETAPLHLDGVRRHVIDKLPARKLMALAELLAPLAD
ncbi:transcriptional repressor MprA [Actinomyces bovis]|uniref:Transcriptional repressor MprA n=1 Tax=Actinomyces bovis TaxID=1658 RepID=A0ABY1VNE5_9ACTO|nr:MarR family transcriptional regulator [Actinomyces bovis]SPT53272.1 transcriptional repressor MprA [Actinomyces bovis]VEG52560.1 transcriptional repressor MprA [Actinomyces israelii]